MNTQTTVTEFQDPEFYSAVVALMISDYGILRDLFRGETEAKRFLDRHLPLIDEARLKDKLVELSSGKSFDELISANPSPLTPVHAYGLLMAYFLLDVISVDHSAPSIDDCVVILEASNDSVRTELRNVIHSYIGAVTTLTGMDKARFMYTVQVEIAKNAKRNKILALASWRAYLKTA